MGETRPRAGTIDELPFLQVSSDTHSVAIEKQLRVEDFHLVRQRFNLSTTTTRDRPAGCLTREEFLAAFEPILDPKQSTHELIKLFDKLNSKETGLINENDFCSHMLQFYQEEDYETTSRLLPANSEPIIRHILHNKQELTAKILHFENPLKFINISKQGYVGLWSHNLQLEKVYSAAEDADDGVKNLLGNYSQARRRANMWITDAVLMPDTHKLVLSSTSRDLRFFTMTSETFLEEFTVYGIKNVPTCLDYYPSEENTESILVFGDDCGSVHVLYFRDPTGSLFDTTRRKLDSSRYERTSNKSTQRIFWDDLKDHDRCVRYHCMGPIHREYIRKILYIPHNDSVIVSSGDYRRSLIITNINQVKHPYIFRLYKGCECFDYSKSLNILITGSADNLARIWNPYVTQKNVAVLEGHHTAVIDIKIHSRLCQCYTFSKDAIVKIWHLKEFVCLQTICIRFPTAVGEKTPNFGSFPADLYISPSKLSAEMSSPDGFIVSCNDYLSLIKLGQVNESRALIVSTHLAPVNCAVYNSKLKQLITCGDNSSLVAWEIESGRRVFSILDAHDGEEITCVAIDQSCRRIATAARNGIIKIWNSSNGQNLLILPSVDDAEVTGLLFLEKGLITVGWSRKIVKYADIVSELAVLKADLSWSGLQIHRDDILCLDHLLPVNKIICTASYDGEINVWSLHTERLIVCLRKGAKSEISSTRRTSSNYRRSASRRSFSQGPTPVDTLLFLRHRAKHNLKQGVLLSSDAGNINCWSLYGERKLMGTFYGPSKVNESILTMCTDSTNRYFVSADTTGQIRLWDIRDYCCSTVSPVPYDISPPPLVHSWQAHRLPITFCQWTDYNGYGNFLFTASTDHTARLWTIYGEEIGIFGQKQPWNIALMPSLPLPDNQSDERNKSARHDEQESKSIGTEKTNLFSIADTTMDEQEKHSLSLSTTFILDRNPTLELSASGDNPTSFSSRISTGLGTLIERGLTQQTLTRQDRRQRFRQMDERYPIKTDACATPFTSLFTQDIDESLSNFNRTPPN